jgi:hypothetical protein
VFADEDITSIGVTEPDKTALFGRMDDYLWPALGNFLGVLEKWGEDYVEATTGVAALVGRGARRIPSTDVLRDYGQDVIKAFNKVYAGNGGRVAAALASYAGKILKFLDNRDCLTYTGSANPEQLLKKLNAEATPAMVRAERNLTQLLMSIIEAENLTAGQIEYDYYDAMAMLAREIPLDRIVAGDLGDDRRDGIPRVGGGTL